MVKAWKELIYEALEKGGPMTVTQLHEAVGEPRLKRPTVSSKLKILAKWGRVEVCGVTDHKGGGPEQIWRVKNV